MGFHPEAFSRLKGNKMNNTFLNYALTYAQSGFFVFPVKERGKVPATQNGCKDATRSQAVIERYWRGQPHANIGFATGEQSQFFVVDIDGMEGEQSLSILEEKYGKLPKTIEVITGGGGRHLYYRWPQGFDLRNSASQIGHKLDIRGEGGYVVAPPSIHPNGRQYHWSVDSADEMAMVPEWLLSLIILAKKGSGEKIYLPLSAEEIGEGCRNDTFTRLTGKLLSHGLGGRFSYWILKALNFTYCKPPLPEKELYSIFCSIGKRELLKRGAI